MNTKKKKKKRKNVWKSAYSQQYKEGYNRIDWQQQANDEKWEEVKTDSGKTIYRLKTKT